MQQGIPSVEALEAVHSFPCTYTIKVIGANQEVFVNDIRTAMEALLDSNEFMQLSERASSKGNHLAVTLRINVQSAHKVRMLYMGLQEVQGIVMVL